MKETNKTNPLGNLLGTVGLVGTGFYLAKKQKPVFTIILGAVAGGIGGLLIGNAIYKFYTYDKEYITNT
jgi:phosphate/sulfate permease